MYSEFWLPKQTVLPKRGTVEWFMRLQNIQQGISNFVRIVCGENIPVMFSSGKQSYTTGNIVVISASTDDTKIDSMVGLALHEGSHVLLSKPLLEYMRNYTLATDKSTGKTTAIHSDLNTFVDDVFLKFSTKFPEMTRDDIVGLFKTVCNILEDRYIDAWMQNRIRGYRPYYTAMFNECFYSDEAKQMESSPEVRSLTVQAYLFWATKYCVEDTTGSPLPGFDEFDRMVSSVDQDPRTGIYENWVACKVAKKMVERILELSEKFPKQETDITCTTIDEEGEPHPNQNLDISNLTKFMEKYMSSINHEIEKRQVSKDELETLQSLKNANAKLKNVSDKDFGDKCKVLVLQNITKEESINNKFFLHKGNVNTKTLSDGLAKGSLLVERLQLLGEDTYNLSGNLKSGKINNRKIANFGFDDLYVFQQMVVESYKPVFLDITLDSSGSMSSNWQTTLSMCIAMAYASTAIQKLTVRLSLRSSADIPVVAVIFDSRVDGIDKIHSLVASVYPGGGTPEGLCFEAIKDELEVDTKIYTHYFVNISDGMPEFHVEGGLMYSGERAYEHTRKQVQRIRDNGSHVLSYMINPNPTTKAAFQKMYGQDSIFINTSDVNHIANTLNDKFLCTKTTTN